LGLTPKKEEEEGKLYSLFLFLEEGKENVLEEEGEEEEKEEE
jgi:hypothetical protein